MNLHMVEIQLEPAKLMQFLKGADLLHDHELGYGIHAWLKAAFGEQAPKPWRLLWRRGGPNRVLAYSRLPAEALLSYLREFADPLVHAVVPETGLASKAMPTFAAGRRLQFEVLCCPVGRQSSTGAEKDVFLLRVEQARLKGEQTQDRATVYREWLAQQLHNSGGAQLLSARIAGFQLVRPLRKAGAEHGQRSTVRLQRPSVLFQGELQVSDGEKFTRLLARGIGRHRAFGFGMVLLKPAT